MTVIETWVLGILLLTALSIFYIPAAVVLVGILRLMAVRVRSAFKLERVQQKSFPEFFSDLKLTITTRSMGGLLNLMFYNPRGGIVVVMLSLPLAALLCIMIAIVFHAIGWR